MSPRGPSVASATTLTAPASAAGSVAARAADARA
eukprot:CAMPEP_0185497414 /NCGR_PEP_ID=MMETSP1366-20130426/18945_1 /TAXON_ID=38817 /ORGANISM="Gephyrocapsa oceanica, Strain RCC1303" /LENGTH=33 /DNA_ID= /DNA_START= /DNA_END= /DNA_ORIENTATION=